MRTLTHCLELDHRRLDSVLLETRGLAAQGSFPRALDRFRGFAAGLSRHIVAEETTLFPALGDGAAGPVRVMCAEHARLRDHLEAILAALASDSGAWAEEVDGLQVLLEQHNAKEERVLYPLSNDLTRGRPDLTTLRTALEAAIADPPVDR